MSKRTFTAILTLLVLTCCLSNSAHAKGQLSASCVIRADKTLGCWRGFAPPTGTFKYVSTGQQHFSCGIRSDSTLACWGWIDDLWQFGQLSPPTGRFKEVSVGDFHACALTDEVFPRAKCWGRGIEGQTSPPFGDDVSYARLASGAWHTCGIQMSATIPEGDPVPQGPVHCWGGYPEGGELRALASEYHLTDLAVGLGWACGVRIVPVGFDNTLCWGDYVPGVSPPNLAREVFTTSTYSCALNVDGSINCWGNDYYDTLKVPTGKFTNIGINHYSGWATRIDGSLTCWGYNPPPQYLDGCPQFTISPSSLPAASLGVIYSQPLTVIKTGNAGYHYPEKQYVYSLIGGAMPRGLQLTTGGALTGKPLSLGRYVLSVQARDLNGFTTTRSLAITVGRVMSPSDANADGRSDLVWRNTVNGANAIWFAGNSVTQQPLTTVINKDWVIASAADFSGDGKADLFWRNAVSGANAIWLSGNSGTALAVAAYPSSNKVAGVGDFNRDGIADLLWRNETTGANVVWRASSSANATPLTSVTNLAWHIVAVADLNGDQYSDIVWRNKATGANSVWYSGSSARAENLMGVTGSGWHVAGAGDFDGDGKADLMWRDAVSGRNVIWRGGRYSDQASMQTLADQKWRVGAIGDYNADGQSDIVWRHDLTGDNSLWRSANHLNATALAPVPNVSWDIAAY